jgi:26S proteasome non-ATPase regulatory subunit 10
MVTILLKQKADPNCVEIEGNTPLHMACEEDRTQVAQILVENQADITLLNKVTKYILYQLSFD